MMIDEVQQSEILHLVTEERNFWEKFSDSIVVKEICFKICFMNKRKWKYGELEC